MNCRTGDRWLSWFRHHDEVAGLRDAIVWREWSCAFGRITKAEVERRQFGSEVDDLDFHLVATGGKAARFRRDDERATEPFALPRRIDGEHPEIPTVAAQLDEDAACECPGWILQHQELAVLHPSANIRRIGAIAGHEEVLDAIRTCDQRCDCLGLVITRRSDDHNVSLCHQLATQHRDGLAGKSHARPVHLHPQHAAAR